MPRQHLVSNFTAGGLAGTARQRRRVAALVPGGGGGGNGGGDEGGIPGYVGSLTGTTFNGPSPVPLTIVDIQENSSGFYIAITATAPSFTPYMIQAFMRLSGSVYPVGGSKQVFAFESPSTEGFTMVPSEWAGPGATYEKMEIYADDGSGFSGELFGTYYTTSSPDRP